MAGGPCWIRDGTPLDAAVMTAPQIVRAILHWSALPGASRHHWGTEIDVIDRAALTDGRKAQLVPAEYGADGVFGEARPLAYASMPKALASFVPTTAIAAAYSPSPGI